jgi:hypothetical protein
MVAVNFEAAPKKKNTASLFAWQQNNACRLTILSKRRSTLQTDDWLTVSSLCQASFDSLHVNSAIKVKKKAYQFKLVAMADIS